MKCLRCGNVDPMYFYEDDGTYYCRKCVMFGRIDVGKRVHRKRYQKHVIDCHYRLSFSLTPYQQQVVKKLNTYLQQKRDTLVFAATGCGKTEIVMQSIENYLRKGKKVGIAISRRQVVLEISQRMQEAFPTIRVIPVCEGHTCIVDGDLIVCTMHQLYRYPQCFDLLIMDEVDAFPYYQNELLENIAKHACVGEVVYLTATPDDKMKASIDANELAVVTLFQRPHGKPLVEPDVKVMPQWLQYVSLYYLLKRKQEEKKQTLIFVPTIKMTQYLSRIYAKFFTTCAFSSQTLEKDKWLDAFRKKTYMFMFCTTVLERGITIKGVDVCVLSGEHIVFNEASLIQIFGRVGRSMEMPYGEGVLMCSTRSAAIKKCVRTISTMNKKQKKVS